MTKHTKETLTFDGFSGYYGSVSAGYGGFNWVDVDFMNATYWKNDNTNWCDTGYQSVIRGAGEAFTYGPDGFGSGSIMVSYNLQETFSLTGMIAASAWETKQPFDFISYTYKNGAFTVKASDIVYLSQTAQKINFATIGGGKPTDFKNIAAVAIVSGRGNYGNTCTYGPYGYTTGNELAFDNLRVKWNGPIPRVHAGKQIAKGSVPHSHHQTAHVAAHLAEDGHHDAAATGAPGTSVHHIESGGYHTQLLSLPGSGTGGGLTSQFSLPQPEHFGT